VRQYWQALGRVGEDDSGEKNEREEESVVTAGKRDTRQQIFVFFFVVWGIGKSLEQGKKKQNLQTPESLYVVGREGSCPCVGRRVLYPIQLKSGTEHRFASLIQSNSVT